MLSLILELGVQPLFQLLAALIVLFIVDWNPQYGVIAALLWLGWISFSLSKRDA